MESVRVLWQRLRREVPEFSRVERPIIEMPRLHRVHDRQVNPRKEVEEVASFQVSVWHPFEQVHLLHLLPKQIFHPHERSYQRKTLRLFLSGLQPAFWYARQLGPALQCGTRGPEALRLPSLWADLQQEVQPYDPSKISWKWEVQQEDTEVGYKDDPKTRKVRGLIERRSNAN